MPTADPTITLLQLGLRGEPMSFAPHVWKTLLALRLLRIQFRVELVTLRELREDLPARLGMEKVTLPVSSGSGASGVLMKYKADDSDHQTLLVEDSETSSAIMDSYCIALWVESTPIAELSSVASLAASCTDKR